MAPQFLKKALPLLTLATLFLSPFPALAEDAGKMVFAIDVIRHGDRGPILDFLSAPHKWPQGLGQLTPEGMNQEYNLGKKLRERYVDQNHLLPPQYDHDTMFVRASDVDRTLMSAECTLLGLYPMGQGPLTDAGTEGAPARFQPIPIHTRPRDIDDVLIPDATKKLRDVYAKYVYDSPEWKERLAKEQPNFEHWSKITGIKITNLKQMSLLGDTTFIRETHHVPRPEGMTDADATAMKALGEWIFETTFAPVEVGRTSGVKLLKQIETYFAESTKPDEKLKYVLFSAHDSTISSLMSAMKAPFRGGRPHYSSDLNIALWKNGDSYTVKAQLNGDPINFPGAVDGVSSLDKFKELVAAQIAAGGSDSQTDKDRTDESHIK